MIVTNTKRNYEKQLVNRRHQKPSLQHMQHIHIQPSKSISNWKAPPPLQSCLQIHPPPFLHLHLPELEKWDHVRHQEAHPPRTLPCITAVGIVHF